MFIELEYRGPGQIHKVQSYRKSSKSGGIKEEKGVYSVGKYGSGEGQK